jgi:hypothetical protein
MDRVGGGGRGWMEEMITSFFCSPFLSIVCKEDSHSETCAQRNAEGGGSLLSGLACRGGSRFPLFFIYCTGAVYILLGSERQKRDQNKIKIKSLADFFCGNAAINQLFFMDQLDNQTINLILLSDLFPSFAFFLFKFAAGC